MDRSISGRWLVGPWAVSSQRVRLSLQDACPLAGVHLVAILAIMLHGIGAGRWRTDYLLVDGTGAAMPMACSFSRWLSRARLAFSHAPETVASTVTMEGKSEKVILQALPSSTSPSTNRYPLYFDACIPVRAPVDKFELRGTLSLGSLERKASVTTAAMGCWLGGKLTERKNERIPLQADLSKNLFVGEALVPLGRSGRRRES